MGVRTHITWCDSTLNLQMGCAGCELWKAGNMVCYAGHLTARYAGRPGWPLRFTEPVVFREKRIKTYQRWRDLTESARTAHREYEAKSWLDGRPRLVFLNDMGDTFTQGLSDDFFEGKSDVHWLDEFLKPLEEAPHRVLLLTKRVSRMIHYFGGPWPKRYLPSNFWLGTSVTNNEGWKRVELLKQLRERTPMVLFVSIEPLTERLTEENLVKLQGLDWVIAGGQSGPDAKPAFPLCFYEVRDACHKFGVPFFFKGWGDWIHCGQYLADGSRALTLERKGLPEGSVRKLKSGAFFVRPADKRQVGHRLDGQTYLELPVEKRAHDC